MDEVIYWLQAAVNGIVSGGVYALVAVSMTLVFGVLRLINFAHGALVTLGMYVCVTAAGQPFGLNAYVAMLPGVVLLFAVGWAIYKGMLDRVIRAPLLMQLTFTLGLLVVLEAFMELAWGNEPRRVRVAGAATRLALGDLYVSQGRFVAFAASIALAVAFWAFLRYSWWGSAIRAVAQNPGSAQLVGIPRQATLAFAFAATTAAAGAAGFLVAPFLTVFPYVGHSFLGAAFAAMVIGTEGNVLGALVGGLIVGLTESLGAQAFGDEYKDACVFALVLMTLLFRPQGLFNGKQAH